VVAPYDSEDARGLLKAAVRDPDPVRACVGGRGWLGRGRLPHNWLPVFAGRMGCCVPKDEPCHRAVQPAVFVCLACCLLL